MRTRRNFDWVFLCNALASASGPLPALANGGDQVAVHDTVIKQIFVGYCQACHGVRKRAPTPSSLKQMSAAKIYESLTTGAMHTQGVMLTEQQKKKLAEYISNQKLAAGGSGDARNMSNQCSERGHLSSDSIGDWNGWGRDLSNTRFQPADGAGLSVNDVRQLQLRWSFTLPGAASVYGQPVVVGKMLFVSADSGYVYALDSSTGCIHWSFKADTGVRSALEIGVSPLGAELYDAYFGDVHGNVYSLDAATGNLHWKVRPEEHPQARITGAVKLYRNRLYVPIASFEEAQTIADPSYPCCTFRGSVVALDAGSGEQIWKTYTINQHAQPQSHRGDGGYLGPSGAGIWNSPTIDPKQNVLYVGTGNSFSGPTDAGSDAVFALDLDNGSVHWSRQLLRRDFWLPPAGPDQDIAASVMLVELRSGQRVAVVAQKALGVWALDPDHDGALLWHQSTPQPIARHTKGGEIVFGGAVDDQTAYFAFGQSEAPDSSGGLVALALQTGQRNWYRAVPPQNSMKKHPGISAAITLTPGIIFTAGLDGTLRAFSASDGSTLWTYNTAKNLQSVNGMLGSGGSIGSAGPIVSRSWVYVTSGYVGFQDGRPGNLLLAFAPRAPNAKTQSQQ